MAQALPGSKSASASCSSQNVTGPSASDGKVGPNAIEMRHPCEWGISLGGGMRYIEGSPNGYGFDFTSAFGSLVVAKPINPSTTLLSALIAETGEGDLDFSRGTLDNEGIGALVGAIVRINDTLDLSVLGGAEWLSYDTTRSGGRFEGEFDAVRYMLDAQLRGLHDSGIFFLDYGGGLRLVHQENDGYVERSGGLPFAKVGGFDFTMLTALGDLKLGRKMNGFSPYVQATGYLNFFDNKGQVIGVEYEEQSYYARLGIGVDVDIPSGKLSLTSGVFGGEDGFQGVDGAFKFVKIF